jgi:agmatine deiminase
VEFIVHPTNRGWTRDSGPIFVRRNRSAASSKPRLCISTSTPGRNIADWRKDRRVPEMAAERPRQYGSSTRRPFILEGGGIEVNGHGTLLTTEECYLDRKIQVRNPGLGRKEFEAALKENLGVTNVLWLAGV